MVDGGVVVVLGPLYLVQRREIGEGQGRCLVEGGNWKQADGGVDIGRG